jgi:probable FeS assembly SUF system protein SufT
MPESKKITLESDLPVIAIPSGETQTLPRGTVVRIMQELGGSYTITASYGGMFRVDAEHAPALGITAPAKTPAPTEFSERLVWDTLKTVYDPEIPVNVVELGLIYECDVTKLENGQHRIAVQMTLTAPGCGMGNVLKADVEKRLSRLPGVKEVQVEIVLDPPWTPAKMSDAAKLQLGFDLDFGLGSDSPLPIVR